MTTQEIDEKVQKFIEDELQKKSEKDRMDSYSFFKELQSRIQDYRRKLEVGDE